MKLESRGISVDVPTGWDANIYQRPDPSLGLEHRSIDPIFEEQTRHVVAHISTFPLPEGRGDYGGGAVELMGPDDALIVLFEYHPDSTATALFGSQDLPWPLLPEDFDAYQMQRPLPGQGGVQRFFQSNGRAFCLYVAIGSMANRTAVIPVVNDILGSVDITR